MEKKDRTQKAQEKKITIKQLKIKGFYRLLT